SLSERAATTRQVRRRIRWVPEAAVRAMHAELVAEHGGRAGIRDEVLLSSALARPRNRRVYGASTTLFELAAGYGVGIIRNHPFIDGNKRLALMVMYVFLEINGYCLAAPEVDAAGMMLRLAASELAERDLARWLRANSHVSRQGG
ncbi:MAG TPA: type II toxin-antitoxin system death-on-curing family toxin, partial [Geobacteraceae bacterium]